MKPSTLSAAACRIRDRTLTSRELVEQCGNVIATLEPRIHAWVCYDLDSALATANERDAELVQGQYRGPLHGIPIGVKDIVDVAGLPTRAGSALTSERPVAQDAAVVARLRAAGAVILGKTVTTEYASFDPPPTRNPWNVQHTPGGSSSGSAAAVAAGMCLAAVGTQTGGSIIRPASYCGVCGFKPSYHRLPLAGVVPLSARLDHIGPLASCVADLKQMLYAMSDSESGSEGAPPLLPPRIGLLETYFLEQADREVAAVTREGLGRLQSAGAMVSVVELPVSFSQVHAQHLVLMAAGAADVHREQFSAHGARYGREIAALIRKGLATASHTIQAAIVHQHRFREEMRKCFADCDVLVTPATPTPAPPRESTGNPQFNAPWSYSGLPTISVPCGLSTSGLPLSLQLIAPHGADERLLAIAEWIERQLKFESTPLVDR